MHDTDFLSQELYGIETLPLKPDEKAAVQALARRYGWLGVGSLLAGPLAMALIWQIATLPFAETNAIAGPLVAMGLFLGLAGIAAATLGAAESFGRWRALRADARGGVVLRREGRLLSTSDITPAQANLLRRGELRRDGTIVQAIEALPRSGLAWRVNGARIGRVVFDTCLALPEGATHEDDGDAASRATDAAPARRSWVQRVGPALSLLFLALVLLPRLPMPGGGKLLLQIVIPGLTILAVMWGSVAIHEGGHLLAGRLMGMEFAWCRVGPLTFWRAESGLRCQWVGLRFYDSGTASMVTADEQRYRGHMAWMVAGGPLANLLVALVMMPMSMAASRGHILPAGEGLFFGIGAFNICIVLGSLVPGFSTSPGTRNDVAWLWWLWRNPEGSRHEAAQLALQSRMMRGERPRDWDPALLERATADPWGGCDAQGRLFTFYHLLDRGEMDAAEAELNAALADDPIGPFHAEAAFFHALVRRNATTARAHRDAVPDGKWDLEDPDFLRAEAALQMIEGDCEGARRSAEKARKALRRNEIAGGLVIARDDWLSQVLTVCGA